MKQVKGINDHLKIETYTHKDHTNSRQHNSETKIQFQFLQARLSGFYCVYTILMYEGSIYNQFQSPRAS